MKIIVVYKGCHSQVKKIGIINARSVRNKLYTSDTLQNNLI